MVLFVCSYQCVRHGESKWKPENPRWRSCISSHCAWHFINSTRVWNGWMESMRCPMRRILTSSSEKNMTNLHHASSLGNVASSLCYYCSTLVFLSKVVNFRNASQTKLFPFCSFCTIPETVCLLKLRILAPSRTSPAVRVVRSMFICLMSLGQNLLEGGGQF